MTEALDVPSLLFALAAVLAMWQLLAWVARAIRQPVVVLEIVGGILVGPTLWHGQLTIVVLPSDTRPFFDAFADVGVVMLMFIVGLEFDRRVLRRERRSIGVVGAGSLVVPACLGALLAVALAGRHAHSRPVLFVVFVAMAMAVTALPVLARIVIDKGLSAHPVGTLALALAAIGDVVVWTALAVVVAVADITHQPWRLLLLVPYAALVTLVVPRVLKARVLSRLPAPACGLLVVALVLASAGATEWMGLHFVFGAFLLGLVTPRESLGAVAERARNAAEPVSSLFVFIYFVVAGARVDLSHLDANGLGELGLILLVAVGGKVGGVYASARVAGIDHRSATSLATLMNVRGMTELILLSVGLHAGLIDSTLYSLMVVMAVVTTVVSEPLLRICHAPVRTAADAAAVAGLGQGPAAGHARCATADDPQLAAGPGS